MYYVRERIEWTQSSIAPASNREQVAPAAVPMSIPWGMVSIMGQDDFAKRTQLQVTVDEIKRLEAHVSFYTYHVMSLVVKAALHEGMTQREAAQFLRLSKSTVNRMARDPLGVTVAIGDPYKNVDRAIEEQLLGERRAEIWEAATAYAAAIRPDSIHMITHSPADMGVPASEPIRVTLSRADGDEANPT